MRAFISGTKKRYKVFASYFWTRTQMSDRDRVLLTPWEEWAKYHRFPAEILLHAGLLAVVIIQIMLMTYQFTGYNRSNEDTFKRIFHPSQFRAGIYSIQDCLKVINDTVQMVCSPSSPSPSRSLHLIILILILIFIFMFIFTLVSITLPSLLLQNHMLTYLAFLSSPSLNCTPSSSCSSRYLPSSNILSLFCFPSAHTSNFFSFFFLLILLVVL
jgi:hypothetical protein